MIKKIIALFCIACGCNATAQVDINILRDYPWESTGAHADSSLLTNSKTVVKERILFHGLFEKNVYFYDTLTGVFDTLAYQASYHYNKRSGSYNFYVTGIQRNTNNTKLDWDFNQTLQLISDSVLNMSGTIFQKQKKDYFLTYYPEYFPEHSYYIQNTLDSTRKIYLDENITFYFNKAYIDPDKTTLEKSIECSIDSMRNDSMYVRIFQEDILIKHKDNSSSGIANMYPSLPKQSTIDAKNLSYTRVRTPFRKFMNGTAKFVVWASLIDLAITPFIGYNFKTKTSNQKLQSAMAISGLCGIGFSIPLAIIGKRKTVWLSKSPYARENNYWILK